MRTFKLFLLTLFAALGLAAQAQTIEVYKDGQVIDSFSAAQVDSVVYKYAEPQERYYYYVGTVKPTADSDIEANGKTVESVEELKGFTIDSDEYVYFCYPTEWGVANITDDNGLPAAGKSIIGLSNVSLTKYNGWRFNKLNSGLHYNVTFKK